MLKTSFQRILLLTGRAGTGKTSTIRVLSKEMGFEILEWKASTTLSNDRKHETILLRICLLLD